jgi:hypothetical protein
MATSNGTIVCKEILWRAWVRERCFPGKVQDEKVFSRHQVDIEHDFRGGGHNSQRQGFLHMCCNESNVLVRTCNNTTQLYRGMSTEMIKIITE